MTPAGLQLQQLNCAKALLVPNPMTKPHRFGFKFSRKQVKTQQHMLIDKIMATFQAKNSPPPLKKRFQAIDCKQ
jgi:hypothetical protein